MKIQYIAIFMIILAAAVFTIALYPQLPAIVPSHWNALGEVDGYVQKSTHISLFLGLCIGLPILLQIIPRLDPKYKNIQQFENTYLWFTVVMTLFMAGLYVFTSLIALGYQIPIFYYMIPAMSILFFTVGAMLEQAKSNYSIGLRLPWTLNSEVNWNETHKFGAKIFKYGSLLFLLTLLLGKNAFFGFIIIIAGMVILPIVYSYRLHLQGK